MVLSASPLLDDLAAFQAGDKGQPGDPLSKVGYDLASTYAYFQDTGAVPAETLSAGSSALFSSNVSLMQWDSARKQVLIDASSASDDPSSLEVRLQDLGFVETGEFGRMLSGWLPIDRIDALSVLDDLKIANAVYAPQFAAGSVNSQGDAAMRADVARATFGVSGAGVKVGVMSDSFNSLGGYASDITTGNLPPNVQIIQDAGGNDEGRAMSQIVYDVAPQSSLAFATANLGQASFASNILALANAGSQVIADDVIYFAEPFFQNGVIAQAVNTVAAQDVSYFSSAGNQDRLGYTTTFTPGSTFTSGQISSAGGAPTFFGGVAHDFDPGPGVSNFQSFTLGNGGAVLIDFQWDQPFASVSGTGSANDADIYLLNAAGTQVLAGSNANNILGDPNEIFSFQNTTGSTQTYNLMIVNRSGAAPGLIKYIDFQGDMGSVAFATNSGTTYGHANTAGAASVGAAYYLNTPAFGLSPPVLEGFSSSGGTPILFADNGTRLSAPIDLHKTDFVAPDGVSTTLALGSGLNPFFGTSAAAPHAAGVAALMKQANPAATATQIRSALASTAIPMANPFFPNYNYAAGAGLIQADAAVNVIQQFQVTSSVPAAGSVVSVAPTSFTVNLSQSPNPFSIDAGDFQVNGIAASTAAYVAGSTSITFGFASSPVVNQGPQSMHIGAGAILRASDSSAVGPFDASFFYDVVPLIVTTTVPPPGNVLTLPATLDLNFSEAVDPASVQASDLSLFGVAGAAATAVSLLNGNTTARFTITSAGEGTVTANIATGAITDAFGNPGLGFLGNYILDAGTVSFPTPLGPKNPAGSLIYDPTVDGQIGFAGDLDAFTINLDPGQTATLVVSPTGALRPSVTLAGPGAGPLTAMAAVNGGDAVLQTVPVAAAGTYTITVGGVGASIGGYNLQLILNAGVEDESHGGAGNNTLADAQNLDGTSVALGGGADRLAVSGIMGGAGNNPSPPVQTAAITSSVPTHIDGCAPTTHVSSSHSGASPFDPPKDTDQVFVVDTGSGLDTGCTFRSGGPFLIDLQIDRAFGDIDKLLQNGLLPQTVTLQLPAYDVDVNGSPPEVDRVTFIDKDGGEHVLGNLTGDDSIWQINSFQIQTSWLSLPDVPTAGGTVQPSHNQIRIDIDTASGSDENWCTAIDWVSVEIPAPDPVLFVHGIFSDPGTWSPVWTNGLNALGIPWDATDMGALHSIQDDAGQIASKFAEMQDRLGVDKINIVSHSKGGLDSRQFAESNDVVDKLIQIGTPNAGSPAADIIQVLLALPLNPEVLAELDLLLPAAYQLTTPYMALYNLTHGFNPNTQYYSIAGDYRFGGIGLPLDLLLSGIYGGANDTVVPAWSVYSVPTTALPAFQSVGSDTQAVHACLPIIHVNTCETRSDGIFNELIPLLETIVTHHADNGGGGGGGGGGGTLALPATVTAPAPSTVANTATIGGVVAPAQVNMHDIPIDDTSDIVGFTLTYGTGNLDLTLVSPSGQTIDPASIAGNPNVQFVSDESVDGLKREFYAFLPGAETGLWTARVRGTSVTDPSGQEPYTLVGSMLHSNIQLTAATNAASYTVGQPITILGTLQNGGAGLTGAAVTASVVAPDRTTRVDLTLHDDGAGGDAVAGDGIYSGQFTGATAPGTYEVILTASGNTPAAFSRQALSIASVATGGAHLAGTYSSLPLDDNGNALYDRLRMGVDVAATIAGSYRVEATLRDSLGAAIETQSVLVNLPAGTTTVNLDFSGRTIFNHGVNGPYTLTDVAVRENVDDIFVAVDSAGTANSTVAFSFGQFEHDQIALLGTGAENAPDFNGNGRLDSLTVSLDISTQNADFYQWSGELVDASGNVAGHASGQGFLSGAVNRIDFNFDGVEIWNSQVNGPYHVAHIVVIGGGSAILTDSTFTTQPYNANDFESGANLVVTAFSVPSVAVAGQSVAYDLSIENQGDRTTESSSWTDDVYLSTDGVFDGVGETKIASFIHSGALAVGSNYQISASFNTDFDFEGKLYLIVNVDAANSVLEGPGEADNLAASPAVSVGPGVDYYRFSLSAGDSATLALTQAGSGFLSLELQDAGGQLLALGASSAANSDQLLANFVAPTTGVYYVVVRGSTPDAYNLLITRNADFDREANDTRLIAQPLDGKPLADGQRALGSVELGTAGDVYSTTLVAGATFHAGTATPADGPGEFVNLLNPRLRLINAAGVVVAQDDNSAADGRNASLSFTVPAGAGGAYYIEVSSSPLTPLPTAGEYVLNVSGNTVVHPAFQVTATDPANGATLRLPPGQIMVAFNDAVLLTSLDAADLTVDGVPADDVIVLDGQTVAFTPGGPIGQGPHTVAIAAGSVFDIQNTPLDAYSGAFTLDNVPPRITAAVPAPGAVALPGNLAVQVTFNEPMLAANLSPDDFSLHGNFKNLNYLASSFSFDATATVLTLNYTALPEDAYALTLFAGGSGGSNFTDVVGNALDGEFTGSFPTGNGLAGGNFVLSFNLDPVTTAYPTPLVAKAPLGSLIYDPTTSGLINFAGDTDAFTLAVDPGQAITVLVTPTSTSLRPTIQLFDPNNSLRASTTATAANQKAFLNSIPTTTAGTYRIVVSGSTSTTGGYTVQVMLNASLENEGNLSGSTNNTLATGQDITTSFITVATTQASATRGAVTGVTDSSSPVAVVQTPSFTDISSSGNISSAVFDDSAQTLSGSQLNGFTFPFFGTTYSSISFSTNGLITFPLADASFTNTDLSTSPSQAAIAALWDDLYNPAFGSSQIYWQVIGSGPSQQLIIQWNNVQTLSGSPLFTFEAILSANGNVQLNYGAGVTTANVVASATVGVKAPGTSSPQRLLLDFNGVQNSFVGPNLSTLIAAPSSGPDYFRLPSLVVGDVISPSVTARGPGNLTLELRNASDVVVATGVAGATNLSKAISNFAITTAGVYYLRISGDANVPYSALVTRNAAFDTEANDTNATPQDIDGRTAVLGSLTSGAAASTLYASDRNGQLFTVNIATGAGTSVGTLPFASTEIEYDNVSHRAFAQGSDGSFFGQEFDIATGAAIGSVINNGASFNGLEWVGATLYGTAITGPGSISTLRTLNPFTGASTTIGSTGMGPIAGLAYDTAAGIMYGLTGGNTGTLVTVNLTTGAATTVGAAGFHAGSLEFGPDGQLYGGGTGVDAGKIFRLNKTTGAGTLIGLTGIDAGTGGDDVTGLTLVGGAGDNDDWYSITATTTAAFRLETSTPADGAGQFPNTLNPKLEIYDASNVLLASGTAMPDGRNEFIQFTPPAIGTYKVRVTAEGGTGGEYFLTRSVADTVAPRVIATSVALGANIAPAALTYTVTFSEPMNNTTGRLTSDDFTLRGVSRNLTYGVSTFSYNATNTVLTLTYGTLPDDNYTLTLNSSSVAFADAAGNLLDGEVTGALPSGNGTAGGSAVLPFTMDPGTEAYTTPLEHEAPLGSYVYDPSLSRVIAFAGDTDAFTLAIDAGQTISILVTAQSAALVPSVSLRDPLGVVLDSATAAGAGQAALLQTIPMTAAGTYTMTVSGANSTLGLYTVQVLLNAAVETSNVGIGTNKTRATAQNLDGSGVRLDTALDTVFASEDFEAGVLPASISTFSSNSFGRIRIIAPPATGNSSAFALLMDSNTDGQAALNEAVYTVDLTGQTQASLSFSHVITADEADALPTDFTGHLNGDGVSISADGVHWRTILSAPTNTTWSTTTIDLAAAAAAAGMTLGPNFQIKFQQFDNFTSPTDGRAYDNIRVLIPAPGVPHPASIAVLGNVGGITLDATDSGWWDSTGGHTATNKNYIAGKNGTTPEFRDYFVFNLAGVSQPINAAQLSVINPSGGFSSADGTETYSLFDVSTALAALQATGTGQTAIFNDLGTGTSFGSRDVSAGDNNSLVSVPLNADGLAAVTAAFGGPLAFGGAITTINPAGGNQNLFGGSATGVITRQLILSVQDSDYYSLTLAAGQTTTVALKNQSGSGTSVAIQDSAGNVLATSIAGPTNFDQVISNFVAPSSDTFYIVVSSGLAASYNLVITRDAAFDSETNNSFATAQPLDGNVGARGGLETGVVPSSFGSNEANSSSTAPFGIGAANTMRYQQLYSSAEFADAGAITGLRFRRNGGLATFADAVENLQINLSYAAGSFASPSAVFALNIGPGLATVFDHTAFTIHTGTTVSTPSPLDIFIPFDTPFTYDPHLGDLLVDISMRQGATTALFDLTTSNQASTTRRVFSATSPTGLSSLTGTVDTTFTGLVTQFVMAPKEDWYSWNVTGAAPNLRLRTSTPADGASQFVNTLNPHIELYNPAGLLVSSGIPLSDARNESIQFHAQGLTPGAYRVRVTSDAGTGGEYFLSATTLANQGPTAGDDLATTAEGLAIAIDVLANDFDPDGTVDPASILVGAGPAHGGVSIDPVTHQVTYTPAPGFSGPDSFTYSVKDDNGAVSGTATVNITVVASLRVVETIVNDGNAQRSNIETISLRFNEASNIAALIASGEIVSAVKLFFANGTQIPLDLSRYQYNPDKLILTIDLSTDGFGGSRNTMLADARYQLALDSSRLHAAAYDLALLLDQDGTSDGVHHVAFHKLRGDFDGNATVNVADRDLLFAQYGKKSTDPSYLYFLDLDGDNVIGNKDYIQWLKQNGHSV